MMRNKHKSFFKHPPCLSLLFWAAMLAGSSLSSSACAQAVPSANYPLRTLWVGVQYSNVHAGFPYQSSQRLSGISFFADYHIQPRLSIEADARFLYMGGFNGQTETNYLAGPRFAIWNTGKLRPYGQFLVGLGAMHFPFNIGDGRYLALAPGGGVNYRLSRRWSLNGEYEYQLWPGSPNLSNQPAHAITPNGFHAGLAYRVCR
jgi:opacity protein-like surface antigen